MKCPKCNSNNTYVHVKRSLEYITHYQYIDDSDDIIFYDSFEPECSPYDTIKECELWCEDCEEYTYIFTIEEIKKLKLKL